MMRLISIGKIRKMVRTLIAFGIGMLLAAPAHAQLNRVKLDAPGKLAFGSTYNQATAALGGDAEPYQLDPPQPGTKALLCDKCAPLRMSRVSPS